LPPSQAMAVSAVSVFLHRCGALFCAFLDKRSLSEKVRSGTHTSKGRPCGAPNVRFRSCHRRLCGPPASQPPPQASHSGLTDARITPDREQAKPLRGLLTGARFWHEASLCWPAGNKSGNQGLQSRGDAEFACTIFCGRARPSVPLRPPRRSHPSLRPQTPARLFPAPSILGVCPRFARRTIEKQPAPCLVPAS